MTDIKFTNDGKKVIVVGKLNSQETIVQEIFVSAGQEIPSGENFVVKSLHDAPAESWKKKNLRELEQRYDRDRAKLQKQIEDQERQFALALSKAKEKTSVLLQFVKNSDEEQLQTLSDFMSGKITHLFVAGYSPEIISWVDSDKVYDINSWGGRTRVDGIKLVSLFGKSDGEMSYRLNEYRDGSGSSKKIYPATSYAAALAMAQAQLDEDSVRFLSEEGDHFYLDSWKKIEGIVIQQAVIDKVEAQADAQRIKRIENLKKELSDLESKAPAKSKKK